MIPITARAAKPIPPSPDSYVYNEHVVSPAAAEDLSRRLAAVEQRTGHQFAVGLFQSLDGESLEDYSNRVFRAWKIGDAKRNDGLLFCLFLQERRWRVEVGYGLEPILTDLEAGEIAREHGVPYFKTGNFDEGVSEVVSALSAALIAAPPERGIKRHGEAAEWFKDILLLCLLFLYLLLRRYLLFGCSLIGGRPRQSWLGDGWFIGGWGGGGWGGGGGGFGGFSGGGGSSGGGGASGGW